MRLLFDALAALIIVFLAAARAQGRDLYVNNLAGNDRFSGQQAAAGVEYAGPVRTIGEALRRAAPSDRIVLANTGQPYRECISLVGSRHSGAGDRRFQLLGNGAVLDGSAMVPPDAWEHYQGAVFRFRPPHVGYQQLFLAGRPLPPVVSDAGAPSAAPLQPREWTLHGGYAYFAVDKAALPQQYPLAFAYLETGVTLVHVQRVDIADLEVRGFQLDGVNLFNTARDVALIRVRSLANGRAGLTVGGASRASLEDSYASHNGYAQLLTLPLSETYLRGTTLLANTAPDWVRQGGRVYEGKQ